MRTAIMSIDQRRAVELGLDLSDLAIIDWFTKFTNSGKMESKTINGEVYWWVSYKKTVEDMPILGFKERQVARRFKALCESGIFDVENIITARGTKVFLRLKSGVYSALYDSDKAVYLKSDTAQKIEEAMYLKSDTAVSPESDSASISKDILNNQPVIGTSAQDPKSRVSCEIHGSAIEGLTTINNERETEKVIAILLNNNTEYWVTRKQLDDWQELYPAVNVNQELRSIKGWCIANPTRRKTRSGVLRFINNWLAKEQNSGHRPEVKNTNWRFEGKTSNAGFIGVESGEIEL